MTEKEFKEALLRGQGRCILAARENPEKFYNEVLWACSNEVAFDAQCEGTRSLFVYEIINCFEDKTPFLNAVINALKNSKSDGRWLTLYLAELLGFFADDGYEEAFEALWEKYEELYIHILKTEEQPDGVFNERDDFENIALVLSDRKKYFFRIAEDIGKLYVEKPFLDGGDFDWLWASKGKRRIRGLEKLAKKSTYIAEYLRASLEEEREYKEMLLARRKDSEMPLRLRVKMNKDNAVSEAVQNYLSQTDADERAKALKNFCISAYPGDPAPILKDAKSDNEELRFAALYALSKIRHPAVREFAEKNLEKDLENALPIFIKNYTPADTSFLVEKVKSVPVDFEDSTCWHHIFSTVIGMAFDGLKAPAELLYYIYEMNYCSNCRWSTLRQMRRRRLLTDEILQECLYDHNDDIRKLAAKKLSKHK